MFISILIPVLILFLSMAFLPLALDTFFSTDELSEMGIYLEDSGATNPIPLNKPCNSENACQFWNVAEQAMG
jgi:hypothetical protein